jgi:hypothetical protein
MIRLQTRLLTALLALAMALVPMTAFAQSAPSGMPSYAAPVSGGGGGSDDETIHGSISSVDDADNFQVKDDRGFIDSVRLQSGTVIQPDGARLEPGMIVTIAGTNRGSVFAANRIDVTSPDAAPAQSLQPDQMPRTRLAPGTELIGTLDTSLDSKSAFAGEQVILTNVSSSSGSINGATLIGSVTDVTRPGQGRTAQVLIHFDSLRLADGTMRPIDGVVASMKVKTKSNAAKEVGGALLGMLAGNAIGKTLFGVSGGGIVGAIGGYMVARDNRSDVVIPANTDVTVQLLDPRRQAQ